MPFLWYALPCKTLSIFSRPADLHWNTFLDDLKPRSGNSSEKSDASKEEIIVMNRSKCPHCRQKLGDFLYADACPRCHKVLPQNQARESAPESTVLKRKPWPVRAFMRFMRFVES